MLRTKQSFADPDKGIFARITVTYVIINFVKKNYYFSLKFGFNDYVKTKNLQYVNVYLSLELMFH